MCDQLSVRYSKSSLKSLLISFNLQQNYYNQNSQQKNNLKKSKKKQQNLLKMKKNSMKNQENNNFIIPQDNQRQFKSLIQQRNDNSGLKEQKLDFASNTYFPPAAGAASTGIDSYLPYDQLDLRNIGSIKLIRTAEDDEFSQIIKKERQNQQRSFVSSISQKNDQFRSFPKDTTLNIVANPIKSNEKLMKSNNLYCDQYDTSAKDSLQKIVQPLNTSKFLQEKSLFYSKDNHNSSAFPFLNNHPCSITNQQNDHNFQNQNTIIKLKKSSFQNGSITSPTSSYQSPQFYGSELSFQNKKQNSLLQKNMYSSDQEAAENLTLEQFSKYSFSRNPFISKDILQFEQSSVITKQIPLDKSEKFNFLCSPCLEILNNLSQDSIESQNTGNESTIKKKKSKRQKIKSDINQTTNKKSSHNKNNSYFNEIQSVRSKLPCFCQNGLIGYKQYYNKLLEIHFEKYVKEQDIQKYYKYLVWKLSKKSQLSIERLFFQIEKRIYLTKHQNFKPFLSLYLTQLKNQAELQKIPKTTNNQQDQQKQLITQNQFSKLNQVILLIGNIIETPNFYLIELTDTWDSIYKVVYKQPKISNQQNNPSPITQTKQANRSLSLDSHSTSLLMKQSLKKNKLKMSNNQLLEDLILKKQLKSHMKLRIANIALSTEQKITAIFQDTKKEYTDLIEISINSLQKEINNQTKIGYLNKPFLRTLSSIKPQGGLIPGLDVFILKKYPLLIQYHQNQSKQIITYCDNINSQIVNKNNLNDYFFAKFIICDSLLIYDKSISLTQSSPTTELIIQFRDSNSYEQIQVGQRIRIQNAICDSIDIQHHYSSGYKINLKAFSHNIIHQEKFLTKQDLNKTISFKNDQGKNILKCYNILDLPKCLNLNYVEAIDFDLKIQFRSFSQNNNCIIGEIKYFNELYQIDIITHDQMFKKKVLNLSSFQTILLTNVHYKSINHHSKKLLFKTSYKSFITI